MREEIRRKLEAGFSKPKPQKKSRFHDPHCSNCSGKGHDVRTCPIPKHAEKPDSVMITLRKPPQSDVSRKLTLELKKQARKESKPDRDYWMQSKRA